MNVATGIVVDGNVVLEGEALAEGSTVTALLREDPETFDLTPEAALAVETTALAAREYHARRQNERRAQREALRQQRLTTLRQAIQRRAPRYPAIGAVYLFGSVLQPGRFTSGSDVDVAVEGADVDTESRFWLARASGGRLRRDRRSPLAPGRGSPCRSRPRESVCMSETFLVLERAVQADLDSIARLYAEIGQPDLPEDAPQDQLDRFELPPALRARCAARTLTETELGFVQSQP